MKQFLEPDFLKFFIPLVGAVIAWVANEFIKQRSEQYQRKEKKYQELLIALKGFYISSDPSRSREQKQKFLDQLDQCWLYCPDDVIRKGYAFLMTVHTSITQSDELKERALGEFILSIRKDLYSRSLFRKTSLKPEEFKILSAT